MFGFLKRKKEEIKPEPKPEPKPVPPRQYRYDVEVRFKDGHAESIKGAEYTWNDFKLGWLEVGDGDEKKYIHTDEAEEVTITRRVKGD